MLHVTMIAMIKINSPCTFNRRQSCKYTHVSLTSQCTNLDQLECGGFTTKFYLHHVTSLILYQKSKKKNILLIRHLHCILANMQIFFILSKLKKKSWKTYGTPLRTFQIFSILLKVETDFIEPQLQVGNICYMTYRYIVYC